MTIAQSTPKTILVLLGAPAAGKNTVATELQGLDLPFQHFKKHRGGAAALKPDEYIDVSESEFDRMEKEGDFLQSHSTYGRKYGVARRELSACWDQGHIPVVHAGRIEHVAPLVSVQGMVAVVCLLACSRDETIRRLYQRHPGDASEVAARLRVYDSTSADILQGFASLDAVRFPVPTDWFSPAECADMIGHVVRFCR